ncbi:MAG: hypothetical protein KTR24_05385 [Saprospiraceae bacterium]|nr:hypothetical protein [Saprospiraceae bacterium]
MKARLLLLAITGLFALNVSLHAQMTFKGICIDGSISFGELTDTLFWHTIVQTEDIVIRESQENFYVTIRTNLFSSVSAYLQHDDAVDVLHVSFSLGDARYIKSADGWICTNAEQSDEFDRPTFQWKLRDPLLRNSTDSNLAAEVHEFYENEIDLSSELYAFYRNNRWVSHTMPIGSMRETEILISKRLLPDIKRLFLTYFQNAPSGTSTLKTYPESLGSITGDAAVDRTLHSGYLPTTVHFDLPKT